MTLKEQAILKVKIDKMHQKYLEAAIKNPKLRDMANDFGDISTGVNSLCAALNLSQQAALERDDRAFEWFEKCKDMEIQIGQLKETNTALTKRLEDALKEYEV